MRAKAPAEYVRFEKARMARPTNQYFRSFSSSGLGMPYWKLQLPETLKARAFETWVPKLELGTQREIHHEGTKNTKLYIFFVFFVPSW